MKNTFLDAVSHELRTPLAAIVGIGLTLEHKADNLADVDRSDLYTRLVANARKLDRLLNDLLDLDRLTHGIVAPKRRPTDVAALAARIADDWGLLNGRRPEVVAQPVTVSLDPAKVERIIENLLANTARHTPGTRRCGCGWSGHPAATGCCWRSRTPAPASRPSCATACSSRSARARTPRPTRPGSGSA